MSNRRQVSTNFVMLLALAAANASQRIVPREDKAVNGGGSMQARMPAVEASRHSLPARTALIVPHLLKARLTGFEHPKELSVASGLQYHYPVSEDTRCGGWLSLTAASPYYYLMLRILKNS